MMARVRGKREAKRHPTGMGRRALSAFLAMVMCFSLLQVGAFAAGGETEKTLEELQRELQREMQIEGCQEKNGTPVYYTYTPGTEVGKGTFAKADDTTSKAYSNPKDLAKNKVTVSKEIRETGTENLFDITLTVETTEAIEIKSGGTDAAVVLVLDVSGSMIRCSDCGEKMGFNKNGEPNKKHEADCKYYNSRDPSTWVIQEEQTRLGRARIEAGKFLETYAGITTNEDGTKSFQAPNGQRKVALVTYSDSAQEQALDGRAFWVDLKASTMADAQQQLNKVTGVINDTSRIQADGYTNTEDGLAVAETRLDDVESISNKFVVLLTDGEPNRMVENGDLTGYSYPNPYNVITGDNLQAYNNAAMRAAKIRQDATLYSICVGVSNQRINNMGTKKDPWTIGDWLGQISDQCVNADDADELSLAFQEIIFRMLLSVNAWRVEDQMGEFIKFKAVDNLSDHTTGAVTTTTRKIGVEDDQVVTVLNWDLKADLKAPKVTKITAPDGSDIPLSEYKPNMACKIVYTLSYQAELDVVNLIRTTWNTAYSKKLDDALKTHPEEEAITLAKAAADSAVDDALKSWHLTNGETRLDYDLTQTVNGKSVFVDEKGDPIDAEDALLHLYFKVPAVKGYAADAMCFTKVNEDGDALANASFTLAGADWSDVASSDANGIVTFTKSIPSGARYTLTETVTPRGFQPVGPLDVEVSYGKLSIDDLPEGSVFNSGTHKLEKLVDPAIKYTVTFTKIWMTDDLDAIPDSITVDLKRVVYGSSAPAETVLANVVINKPTDPQGNAATWSYDFTDMPLMNADGQLYRYFVTEHELEGFRIAGNDSLSISNIATGDITINVEKVWAPLPADMDADSMPGVTVKLMKGSTEAGRTVLNKDNGWKDSFTVPKYDVSGNTIHYQVVEEAGSYLQVSNVSNTAGTDWTITNTVADDSISISGVKTWNDTPETANRPDSITVRLMDGDTEVDSQTVSAENGWSYDFGARKRYEFRDAAGNVIQNVATNAANIASVREIRYTVVEDTVTGYAPLYSGYNIANTRSDTVDIAVEKHWAADLPGTRHGEVKVQLYADGTAVGEPKWTSGWKCTFPGQPKYSTSGALIEYDVAEIEMDVESPENYTPEVTHNGYAFIITNTPAASGEKTSVIVTKEWKQPSDVRQRTAEFTLFADKESTGKTLEITGNGTKSFTDLDKYRENEKGELVEIQYTVEETKKPNGYREELPTGSGPAGTGNVWVFTNTIDGGEVDVKVTKSWVDPDAQDRPDILTVKVQTYNFETSAFEDLKGDPYIQLDLSKGETEGVKSGLPEFKDGKRCIYTVVEESVPGYSPSITPSQEDNGDFLFEIVNTISYETAVSVSKVWVDDHRNPAERPEVTLDLLQNGAVGGRYLHADGSWTADGTWDTASVRFYYDQATQKVMADITVADFSDTVEATVTGDTYSVNVPVPRCSQDRTLRYTYTAEEYNVSSEYEKSVSTTSATVTNTRSGSHGAVVITKYWMDPIGTDHPQITLKLTGKASGETLNPIAITADDDNGRTVSRGSITINGNVWKITLDDLPGYHNGSPVEYELSEDAVSGYSSEVNGMTVTNTIDQSSDFSVSASKVWRNMDAEGEYTAEYPDSITVGLFRVYGSGSDEWYEPVTGQANQTVTKEDGYAIADYTGLDRYDDATRQPIVYKVMEVDSKGVPVRDGDTIRFGENNEYTVTYEGGTIVNTFNTPQKYLYEIIRNYHYKGLNGTKDYSETSGILFGEKDQLVKPDPSQYAAYNGVTYSFTDGAPAQVTLERENYHYKVVLNYVYEEKAPEEPVIPPSGGDDIDVVVEKVWRGDSEEDRPESITVQLLRDGKAYDTRELSADNRWKTRWLDLSDQYDWTVEELDVPDGYTAKVSGNNNRWTITNTLDGGLPIIPDEPVPGGDKPGGVNPGDGDDEEIIIPDTDVPTGDKTVDPPKTGDAMGLWAAAAAVSGIGLSWVTLSGRKRKEEE